MSTCRSSAERLQRTWQIPSVARLSGTAGIGAVSWTVDTGLLWLLAVQFSVAPWLAAAIGMATSGALNFTLNRLLYSGRGQRLRHAEIWRYGILFAGNLMVVSLAVPALASMLGGVPTIGARLLISKLALTVVILGFNAFMYRNWVFTTKDMTDLPPTDDGQVDSRD